MKESLAKKHKIGNSKSKLKALAIKKVLSYEDLPSTDEDKDPVAPASIALEELNPPHDQAFEDSECMAFESGYPYSYKKQAVSGNGDRRGTGASKDQPTLYNGMVPMQARSSLPVIRVQVVQEICHRATCIKLGESTLVSRKDLFEILAIGTLTRGAILLGHCT